MKSKIIIGAIAMMAQSENVNAVSLTEKNSNSGIFSSMVEIENADATIKEQKAT